MDGLTVVVVGWGKVYAGFWWGNLRERGHLLDSGIDGRIIIIWIFWMCGVGVWFGST
jgi:hypothetical protein